MCDLKGALVFQIVLFIVRLVDWSVFRLTIRGRENLRRVDSAFLVSNHTLVVDPGVIAHVIRPHRTYFTMLEETALIPYLGTFVRLLGGVPILRSSSEHTYFLTDNGNAILDVDFGLINDPASLEKQIKLIPGVVESGLFVNMAKTVYIGTCNDVKQIDKRNFKP